MQAHLSYTELPGSARSTTAPDAASIRVNHVSLSCGDVLYRQLGSGPALILLHGWATSSRFWSSTLLELAALRSCYALDMPGFGESPALKQPTTIAALAAVVIEFADRLGLTSFDLNTHSFGAAVGIYLAAHWPERVRRLVLTSYGLLHDPNDPVYLVTRTWLRMGQLLWQPVYNQLDPFMKLGQPFSRALVNLPPFPQFLEALLFEGRHVAMQRIQDEVADVARMDIRAHIGCMLSSGDPDLIAAMPEVWAPTLLVYGQNDRLVPRVAATALHASLPNCRLTVLESCGHVPVFEHAEIYHTMVRDFLST